MKGKITDFIDKLSFHICTKIADLVFLNSDFNLWQVLTQNIKTSRLYQRTVHFVWWFFEENKNGHIKIKKFTSPHFVVTYYNFLNSYYE